VVGDGAQAAVGGRQVLDPVRTEADADLLGRQELDRCPERVADRAAEEAAGDRRKVASSVAGEVQALMVCHVSLHPNTVPGWINPSGAGSALRCRAGRAVFVGESIRG